jgi:hypothetical protein
MKARAEEDRDFSGTDGGKDAGAEKGDKDDKDGEAEEVEGDEDASGKSDDAMGRAVVDRERREIEDTGITLWPVIEVI